MAKLDGAFIVDSNSVPNVTIGGTGGYSRTTIDRSVGCQNLVQRVITVREGGEISLHNDVSEEVLFVVSGKGDAIVENHAQNLPVDTALLIPPGRTCNVFNYARNQLVLVSVVSPQPGREPASQANANLRSDHKISVHQTEESSIPAGCDRYFKLLIDPRYGCRNLTQFMGFIQSGKAPFHTHTYEEVIYILSGDGIVHVGDDSHEMKAGTCVYLSPGTPHCLENPGPDPLKLLGVFCPAGDPGSHGQ